MNGRRRGWYNTRTIGLLFRQNCALEAVVTVNDAAPSLKELYDTLNADLEKTRRELIEIEALLRQTSNEVEKLQQRELTVSNRLRDLDVNIDRYSKADIKNFYASAQEVQMRLLTMRSQLEQLQYRQQAARQRQSQVFALITALEPLLGVAAPAGGAPGMIGSDQLIADIIQAQEKERSAHLAADARRSGAIDEQPCAARRNLPAPARSRC
jgi:two-component system sensor histidine kinase DegS